MKNIFIIIIAAFFVFTGCTVPDLFKDDTAEEKPEAAILYPDSDKVFTAYNISTSSYYSVPAYLKFTGIHCLVYAACENASSVNAALAQSIAAEFDNDIYALIKNKFGAESDVNGDGKITIFILDIKDNYLNSGAYAAGYFNYGDLYLKTGNPYSNECDMVYMDCNPLDAGSSDFYMTIAHEFQHMINYNEKAILENISPSDTWITEGLSGAAEQIYLNAQVNDKILYYIIDPSSNIKNGKNFLTWSSDYACYSTVYLFFQWLRIHASNGDAVFKEIVDTPGNDADSVIPAVRNRISDLSAASWKDIIRTWFIANYLCRSTGIYGYKSEISSLTKHNYTYTGHPSYSLYPGEGIFIAITSAASMTPSGNIDYAGFNLSAVLDTDAAGGYSGQVLLCYNFYDDTGLSESTTALPSYIEDLGLNFKSALTETKLPTKYRIDFIVDPPAENRKGQTE